MEYAVLRAVRPTWLNLQLPTEVADLIQYRAEEMRGLRAPGKGISFLARGPGVARVVATYRAGDVLAVETLHNRYIAPARLTEKLVFNLPEPVEQHLRLKVQRRGPNQLRSTDDGLIWFLPAPEYYEFRAREWAGKEWTGPSSGGLAHVYLARSIIPLPNELNELESRIESIEWRPRLEALQRNPRGRRGQIADFAPGSGSDV
jgi:hypothetical protein